MVCVCGSVHSQTRLHGECVSGLHRVHSVYGWGGGSVAAARLHNGISQHFCAARAHKHTNALISPPLQTSRLAVTKQSTYPVLAVRGKLQQSSGSLKDTYPLTSPPHKSHWGRGGGRRGRKECAEGSATWDRDEGWCSKAGWGRREVVKKKLYRTLPT